MSGSQLDTVKYVDRGHNPIHNVVLSQPDNSPSEVTIVTQPSIECSKQLIQSLETDQVRLLDQANAFNKSNKEDTVEIHLQPKFDSNLSGLYIVLKKYLDKVLMLLMHKLITFFRVEQKY